MKARVNSPYLIILPAQPLCSGKIIRKSRGQDPKPGDLAMARLNPAERREEDRTH